MSLRSDLVPVVDAGRQLAADLGLRQRTVTIRTRTWSGSRVGSGTATDSDLVLSPPPRVGEPPGRYRNDTVGQYETGDLLLTRVSRTLAESAMMDPGTANVERFFLVTNAADGDTTPRQYRMTGAPVLRSFGWEINLTRMNRPGGP